MHITRLHGGFFNLRASAQFLDYQTAGGYHPDDGCFFPENRPFSILLLCTYYTLAFTATYTTLAPYSASHVTAFDHFFRLPECTGAHYQTARWFFSKFGWLLPIFLTTRLHGGYHPDDGCFFPRRKPIVFNNIIKHLLHSCIHCDLDHSCTIFHKSSDLHLA